MYLEGGHLADQLTLFKPGGQIISLTLLPGPHIQKAIYTSEADKYVSDMWQNAPLYQEFKSSKNIVTLHIQLICT